MSMTEGDQEPVKHSTTSNWYSWVDTKPGFVVLDGGLGSLLTERGNDLDQGAMWSGRLLCENPEELRTVAMDWLSAGADIISTATYQVSEDLLRKEFELSHEKAEEVLISAWNILDSARKSFWASTPANQKLFRRDPKIAISFGPLSAVLDDTDEYSGLYRNVSPDDFARFHYKRAEVFARHLTRKSSDTTIFCYETIGNSDEALAVVETMSRSMLRDFPYWITFQCCDESRLACGATLSSVIHDVLASCRHENLVAIGVNCVDVGLVETLTTNVKSALASYASENGQTLWRIDTVAYPNSGEKWSDEAWNWPSGKQLAPSSWAVSLCSSQAKILGGCCRTALVHILELHAIRLREGSAREFE